jgi:hypothetical protein
MLSHEGCHGPYRPGRPLGFRGRVHLCNSRTHSPTAMIVRRFFGRADACSKGRRLTRSRGILALLGSARTQTIPKRVSNGEPISGHPETGAPFVNANVLSDDDGGPSIRRNAGALRSQGTGRVRGSEEGAEREPSVGREPSRRLGFHGYTATSMCRYVLPPSRRSSGGSTCDRDTTIAYRYPASSFAPRGPCA